MYLEPRPPRRLLIYKNLISRQPHRQPRAIIAPQIKAKQGGGLYVYWQSTFCDFERNNYKNKLIVQFCTIVSATLKSQSMTYWDAVRTACNVVRIGTVSGVADVWGVHHATVARHVDTLEVG